MDRVCKKCSKKKLLSDFCKSTECRYGYRYTCKLCMNKQSNIAARKRRRNNWKGQGGHNKEKCILLRKIKRTFNKWTYRIKLGYDDIPITSLTMMVQIRENKKFGKKKTTIEKNKIYQKKHKEKNQILYNQKKADNLRKGRSELSDWYIRSILRNSDISSDRPEILELKREQLKLHRKIYEKERHITNIK